MYMCMHKNVYVYFSMHIYVGAEVPVQGICTYTWDVYTYTYTCTCARTQPDTSKLK